MHILKEEAEVMYKITGITIQFASIGILGLVATVVAKGTERKKRIQIS